MRFAKSNWNNKSAVNLCYSEVGWKYQSIILVLEWGDDLFSGYDSESFGMHAFVLFSSSNEAIITLRSYFNPLFFLFLTRFHHITWKMGKSFVVHSNTISKEGICFRRFLIKAKERNISYISSHIRYLMTWCLDATLRRTELKSATILSIISE